ncbi:MAG: PAS domain S-box protein [Thiotrichales bacterium]
MDSSVENAQRLHFWSDDPRVRGIVENVADGVIGIDAAGSIELFNPEAERLFGYPAAEVMGRNVKLLMPPAHGDYHDAYLAHYLHTGERRIIGSGRSVHGQRKDGSTFPMYLSVGEVHDFAFHGFIGIVHDLSAEQAAEESICSGRAFLQSIIDSMPSILVGIDRDGCITHWNRAAAQSQEVPSAAAIGRPFSELFPRINLKPDELVQAITERRLIRKERQPLTIDGQSRHFDVVVYPLDHDATGAVVRIDDVTERVRIEEMMVQTEKMMSVGGLAAGMAHEINNPLGILAQGCQNLVRRVSSEIPENVAVARELGLDLEVVREYLQRRGFNRFIDGMQEATTRANRIITDMLAYCRRGNSSFQPVRMNTLIDTVLRLAAHDYDLKRSFDFRRIAIHRETAIDDDHLLGDEMAIEQVLLNLLRNAAQAMAANPPERAAAIHLALFDEGEWLRLEVTDTGPGLSDAVAHRLFEPFFTTKPVGVGTGLGLSVAYFIVTEQHRGTLEARPSAGQGARFVLRLPREGKPYDTCGSDCR